VTRRIVAVLSAGTIILALGHLAIGAASFDRLSFQALWFMGSGVAIMLGGMINLLALFADHRRAGRLLLLAANLAMAAFFGLALPLLPQPQVIAGLLLFLALAVLPRPVRAQPG